MLTFPRSPSILNLPLQKTGAGRGNSNCTGAKASAYLFRMPVFFCLPKINAVLYRLKSIMAGLFGQRSALAAPCARFSTPYKSVSKHRGKCRGGYSKSTGEPQ